MSVYYYGGQMPEGGFLALVHNASLLLALALVYDLATTRWRAGASRLRQVPVGLAVGGIGVAVMLSSWTLEPGIVFDTRSILLGVAGLYFGTVPAVIAMAVTAAFRIWMGGAATFAGVSVIVASGCIGLFWRYRRRSRLADLAWFELYALGLAVHVVMLGLMFTLPWSSALRVLSHITLPVLLIYPPATAALGLLMANRLKRERDSGALRERESLFRALFDQTVVGVAQVDTRTGAFLRVNQRYAEIVGYSREELGTLRFQDVTYPEDVARDVARMDELAAGRISEFTVDKRYLRRDGSVVWGSLAVSPMWEPGEPPTTNISMVLDITERKRAEEEAWATEAALRRSEGMFRELNAELERRVSERTAQLEEANKELEAFSYSVSHDLRAPLRAIDGFSRMIVEDHGERLDPEGRRLLGVVSANARRMAQLIDDLLRLSRLGRSEVRRTSVDMATLARNAFEEIVEAPEARGRIEFRVGDLPRAVGDPALLRQVWVNLLSNAVKFTANREWPVIEVDGEVEGPSAVYRVKDNGAGFNMDYSGKLFGVFQRLHAPSEFEGTGVGLALVRRIVLRHGGRAWAEGRVGEGATFSFSLPAS
ncbi:MAG: PAS domain S-box protein [Holophagales bacterium]|nr:PAS domain S-box protein [Holophagales bacterium]